MESRGEADWAGTVGFADTTRCLRFGGRRGKPAYLTTDSFCQANSPQPGSRYSSNGAQCTKKRPRLAPSDIRESLENPTNDFSRFRCSHLSAGEYERADA
jgi:hypothetical protein